MAWHCWLAPEAPTSQATQGQEGRWYSDNRYAVQVPSWGGIWWVADAVPGGMKTTTVKTEADVMSTNPQNFEKNDEEAKTP